MRMLVGLAVICTALAVAAPAAAATASRAPAGFHGVMWDRAAIDGAPVDANAQWALMRRSGVKSVRVVFSWAVAQPVADTQPSFARTDALVELSARHGVGLLPVVLDTPGWAARNPGRAGSQPEFPSDYAAYMARLVQRYGPSGTFWAERPDLPRRPIRDWQIWNEPHFDFFWFTRGNWADEYVRLLRAAEQAIHANDAGARVVLAALANASWRELGKAMRAGARRAFDVATINIFTGRPGFVMTAVRLTRAVLAAHGAARRPIWVTETTFPAARGRVRPPAEDWQRRWYTTPREMARRLRELYSLGAAGARRLGLGRIYWYTWASSYTGRGDVFDYTGLVRVRTDGAVLRQPALSAFRRSAAR